MHTNSDRRVQLAVLDWLARGVDTTSLTPFSIEQVEKWIATPRLVAFQNDKKTNRVTIAAVGPTSVQMARNTLFHALFWLVKPTVAFKMLRRLSIQKGLP
ncbi:hypothetical protein PM082_020857 [Marasmius tenuissimus]|nr:hypothetical protein PM082_020857 [Marasmius tenuissimus]